MLSISLRLSLSLTLSTQMIMAIFSKLKHCKSVVQDGPRVMNALTSPQVRAIGLVGRAQVAVEVVRVVVPGLIYIGSLD